MKNLTLLLLLLVLCAAHLPARAQSGCRDPRATNYNPAATVNDGSCQYATTTSPLPLRAPLDAAVPETSGLQYSDQKLWTFNDSGNPPVLFRVDSVSGNVVQQVTVSNFPNVDWEDIAADAQYLYVGDCGNNSGDRQNLKILRVAKAAIGPGAAVSVAAQAIHFSYPDQTSFTPNNTHNFDCEAFFYFNDSLHLFTKNRGDLQTKYYTVPAQPGTYVAHFKARFNVNGLITAADLNAAGTGAALLGYNTSTGATFLWLLSDFAGTRFLAGNKRRIELPNALFIGQAEGLCFIDNYRVFVSNERISSPFTVPQRLYALNTRPWLAPALPTATSAGVGAGISIAPNPARHALRIARTGGSSGALELALQDLQGRIVLTAQLLPGRDFHDLDVSQVSAGVYVLQVTSPAGRFSRKIEIP